jgi:heme exporter protein A
MLKVNALAFDYIDKPVLSDVQFSLSAGKLLHLQGGNGVGKTTLLRLLAGLLQPSSGGIFWNDASINDDLPSWQQRICYVGHKMGLCPDLTIRENCYFDLHWQRRQVSFPDLLKRFNLSALADIPCGKLSQGQKRRAALLRFAMTDARVWLLDEPFVALDRPSMEVLAQCLKQHLAGNGLIVMTSHQSLADSFDDYEVYAL